MCKGVWSPSDVWSLSGVPKEVVPGVGFLSGIA